MGPVWSLKAENSTSHVSIERSSIPGCLVLAISSVEGRVGVRLTDEEWQKLRDAPVAVSPGSASPEPLRMKPVPDGEAP